MKRLYRSTIDRKIAGVCGGVGEYFGIDPVIVRVIFAVLLFTGLGVIAYLIMWILVPKKADEEQKQ
jgi:Putative stress-responsive transcriptional regulator